MTGPRIETSDRGITINKSLAWTMIVGLVSAGVWLGAETRGARVVIEQLAEAAREDRAKQQVIEGRVSALERGATGRDVQLSALLASMNDLKAQQSAAIAELRTEQRETQRLIRDWIQRSSGR